MKSTFFYIINQTDKSKKQLIHLVSGMKTFIKYKTLERISSQIIYFHI